MMASKGLKQFIERYLKESNKQFIKGFQQVYKDHLLLKGTYLAFKKSPCFGDIAKRVLIIELKNDWSAQKIKEKNMKITII